MSVLSIVLCGAAVLLVAAAVLHRAWLQRRGAFIDPKRDVALVTQDIFPQGSRADGRHPPRR